MAHFYGWGSTASRLEPLRGGSLLSTTKSPEIPGNYRNMLSILLKKSKTNYYKHCFEVNMNNTWKVIKSERDKIYNNC